MNERMRAIEILSEAKQILSERLTEQVIDAGEEILADARGDSYMNDIETVYEQVGIRLAHVNQMLSNLPAETEGTQTATAAAQYDEQDAFTASTEPTTGAEALFVADTTAALPGPVFVATPALPAPRPTEDAPEKPAPRTFQAFAAQIQAGDLLAAGRSLAALFEIEEARAIACAAVFADRIRRDPNFLRRAMQLRSELESGGYNRALVLLFDCFGLNAAESITVIESLRRRLRIEC